MFKVRQHDTLKILARQDHAQVAAPGYGMYYLWIVRHLAGDPYTGFEFSPEHTWMLDPKEQGWEPGPEERVAQVRDARAPAQETTS